MFAPCTAPAGQCLLGHGYGELLPLLLVLLPLELLSLSLSSATDATAVGTTWLGIGVATKVGARTSMLRMLGVGTAGTAPLCNDTVDPADPADEG